MAKLKPLGDRIVVLPADRETVTASGIVLPETAKEKPQEGTVIAVGPGKLLTPANAFPPRNRTGSPRSILQVLRHRIQARRQRIPDSLRARRACCHRLAGSLHGETITGEGLAH